MCIISWGEVPVVPPRMADNKIIQHGILQPTFLKMNADRQNHCRDANAIDDPKTKLGRSKKSPDSYSLPLRKQKK